MARSPIAALPVPGRRTPEAEDPSELRERQPDQAEAPGETVQAPRERARGDGPLAAGRAVAGFKGVVSEEVVMDGQTGAVVFPLTAEALAGGMERLLKGDYKQMGMRGRELIAAKYSVRQMAYRVEEVYKGL